MKVKHLNRNPFNTQLCSRVGAIGWETSEHETHTEPSHSVVRSDPLIAESVQSQAATLRSLCIQTIVIVDQGAIQGLDVSSGAKVLHLDTRCAATRARPVTTALATLRGDEFHAVDHPVALQVNELNGFSRLEVQCLAEIGNNT